MPRAPLLLRTLAIGAVFACGAAAAQVDEAALKAAIVYNLLLFAHWPADAAPPAGGPLALCVDPASPLAAPLRTLQGRAVREHRLDVRDVPAGDAVRRCHALYLDAASRHGAAARRHVGGAPVLVVSDETGADDGAVVHLARAGGRVAFDVDLRAARRCGLQLSSKLLRLAREVRE